MSVNNASELLYVHGEDYATYQPVVGQRKFWAAFTIEFATEEKFGIVATICSIGIDDRNLNDYQLEQMARFRALNELRNMITICRITNMQLLYIIWK